MPRSSEDNLAEFTQLYRQWLTPVYRYFYHRVGNERDAEDLTSQVFLKVYEALPRYHNRDHFSAWLFTIARHQAADFFRASARDIPQETVRTTTEAQGLLNQTERSEEIQRLSHLIKTLPEKEQELIRLRFVANLKYREIGEVLHKKEDSVRKKITRLLARLKDQLEKYNG